MYAVNKDPRRPHFTGAFEITTKNIQKQGINMETQLKIHGVVHQFNIGQN